VVCSDIAGYRDKGADVALALRRAGAREVYLVGEPATPDQLPEATGYLRDGGDVLQVLRAILRTMGILKP
jgi:hypothetical protein